MTIRKKILSLLLSAAVVLTMSAVPLCSPLVASAADPATPDDISKSNVIISDSGSYIITGSTTTNTISVTAGSPSIILQYTDIQVSGCAFSIASGASVNLTLIGTNTLKSGDKFAGLAVSAHAELTISAASTGSLKATGGEDSAGIGGSFYEDVGTINISGGTVTANGGNNGAAIGGGSSGNVGIINISGGTVMATGGSCGAGIGRGNDDGMGSLSGATINISGGNVTANGGDESAGIGGGIYRDGGNVTITGSGTHVIAKGQGSGYDIGSGEYSTSGGSLTVGDTNITTPLPSVEFANTGTNATSTYKNCVVLGSGAGNAEGVYDASGNRTAPLDISKSSVALSDSGSYIITGSTTANTISVTAGSPIIILQYTDIQVSGCAFSIASGASVKLTLVGTNTLKSGTNCAGLQVPEGATLTIADTSIGTLESDGGSYSAGIGSGAGVNGGIINISGGDITAMGGSYGAGIGGGYDGSGGIVNINGGDVTAKGGLNGSGIGGGIYNCGGTVAITGSGTNVYAQGNGGGNDIGSGHDGGTGGSLTVGDTTTITPLPNLELKSAGTNAATTFKNCIISNAANPEMTGTYNAEGYIQVSIGLVSPANAVNGNMIDLEADISGYADSGTVQFSYKAPGSGSFTNIGNEVSVSSGKATAEFDIPIIAGDYTVKAVFISANGYHGGSDSKTLSVISTDSSLSNLTISAGTLSPAFASNVTGYTSSVSYSTDAVTVKPTVKDANATVMVNGKTVTNGTASGSIALESGKTTEIDVVVTAQDGKTSTTYKISVARGAYIPPAPQNTTISGLQNSGGDYTATITSDYANSSTYSNVAVNCGNLMVTLPSTVISGALGSGSFLTLDYGHTNAGEQTAINAVAAKCGISPLLVFDIKLTRHNSSGTTEEVHNLSGYVTVTVTLNEEQLAALKAGTAPHIYYYDPDTGILNDMNATFDLSKGTATFTTNHFSTYLLSPSETLKTGVTYASHVQRIGLQKNVNDGAISGTTGRSLRLEAFNLSITGNVPASAIITYQAHVQRIGWQKPVSNGASAGTTGKSLRMEALKITLNGLDGYQVKYRVHVQGKGWLSWQVSKNGTAINAAGIAGTTGQSRRIEAVQVIIEKV